MDVEFIKGERSDRMVARRADGKTVAFELPKKGPVPHDAVHFFVEEALGTSEGFWGLVARGVDPDELQEMAKAAGHASAKRARVPDQHIVPIVQAERIVEAFEADFWGGGSDNDSLRAMVSAGCDQSLVPVPSLTDFAINGIRNRLAGFRDDWAFKASGASIRFIWPETFAA
jgi:hypothetical protein